MLFHEFLRMLRQSREIGMREFAHKINMDVGNYSKLERGILSPPQKPEVIAKIADVLQLDHEEKEKLMNLASLAVGKIPEDIIEDVREYEYLPVLLRTIVNKHLTNEQLKELAERINKEF